MPAPSRKTLIAGAVLVASLAFAGGFSVSAAAGPEHPREPIVNVRAWDEKAPAPIPVSTTRTSSAQCNPWEVSDIAMEEVLQEMKRRGWRAPNQGDAVASLASLGVDGIGAVDPYAPMPSGGDGRATITVLTDAEAEQLRTEQITLEQLIVEQATQQPS